MRLSEQESGIREIRCFLQGIFQLDDSGSNLIFRKISSSALVVLFRCGSITPRKQQEGRSTKKGCNKEEKKEAEAQTQRNDQEGRAWIDSLPWVVVLVG